MKVKDYMKNTLKSKNSLASVVDKIRSLEDEACKEILASPQYWLLQVSGCHHTLPPRCSHLSPGL